MLTRWAKDLPNVKDKILLRLKNQDGNTALHEAVLTGDVGLVRHMLREDLEPMYWKNVDQKSPLYLALNTRNSEMLQVLFSLLLEPSMIEGMPPVHGAVACDQYGTYLNLLMGNIYLCVD
ncbi:hypothetical protein NL676_000600 [Syzygium grande]|nr:hypothetical protein NL676_000598 [Syzygium grande]KAI6672694.1 hypothetical protein NL676_000600 [Syzygium grande]